MADAVRPASGMTSPSALHTEPLEILRFYPRDPQAKRNLHLLLTLADHSGLDAHNKQFICRTGKKIKITLANGSFDSLDEGYLSVGWYETYLSGPNRFTLGSGHPANNAPTVDILLTPPQDLTDARIAPIHLTLMLQHESGAWTVTPHADVGIGKEDFTANQMVCLCEAETTIAIGHLVYVAEFMIKTTAQEQRYLTIRNKVLELCDGKYAALRLDTKFSAIPFKSDLQLDIAIPHRALGSGAFGTVFAAFHPKTGAARAVKRLVARNQTSASEIGGEVGSLRELAGQWGIVQTYGFRNRSGRSGIPTTFPEDYYIVMEKGISFKELGLNFVWIDNPRRCWYVRACLAISLLVGLEAIHLRGGMHRDITWSNILFFNTDSGGRVRGVLADLGKCIKASTSIDENIGNQTFLPPEIEKGKGYSYTPKIDLWMLAYALIMTFGPGTRDLGPPYINANWHKIMDVLDQTELEGQHFKNIMWLMFMRNPDERPSVSDIIQRDEFKQYLSKDDWDYVNSRRYRGGGL